MGPLEIEGFLGVLAHERRVAASTHNQALSALLFLYREVLGMDLPWLDGVQRPRTPKRIPSVLTVAEVASVLSALPTDMAFLARLLYGAGMGLTEGLRLRIKDVDFDRGVAVVRQAKGSVRQVIATKSKRLCRHLKMKTSKAHESASFVTRPNQALLNAQKQKARQGVLCYQFRTAGAHQSPASALKG